MSGAAISQGPQAIDPGKGRPAKPKSKIRNSSSGRKKSPPLVSCRLGCARRHHIAFGFHLAPKGRLAWARAQLLMLNLLCRPINWRVNFFGDKQADSSELARVMVADYTSNMGRDMPEAMIALSKVISTAIGSVDPGPGASRHRSGASLLMGRPPVATKFLSAFRQSQREPSYLVRFAYVPVSGSEVQRSGKPV